MKETIKKTDNAFWLNWLTRKLNSLEVFDDFALGKNPQTVAEKFISLNEVAISEVFEEFDEEDKETLDQFQKLTECEWHVLRILNNQIELRDNIRFVDFKKEKSKKIQK